jgi:LrgA family
MIRGMATLLGFQLAGELIARLGHLPISGPICGMAALLAWLHLKGEVESELGKVCDGILANMAILFVPVGVGAISYSGRYRPYVDDQERPGQQSRSACCAPAQARCLRRLACGIGKVNDAA